MKGSSSWGGLMAFVWWDWGRATRCFGPVFQEHVENSWPIRGGVDLFLILKHDALIKWE